jgi:5-methylcytosine-specific restriction endonuclease McrA
MKNEHLSEDEKWRKRLNGFFIAFCRKVFRWSPAYRNALKMAIVDKTKGYETYKCSACNSVVPRSDKQVDHRIPVTDRGGWNGSWDTYAERIFCSVENLDVLCKPCHKEKSKKEAGERAKVRKAKKEKLK